MSTERLPSRPPKRRGRAEAPATIAGRVRKRLNSSRRAIGRRHRHRGALDDPDLRPARHLVPARATTSQTSGWWTFFTNPQFTL